MALAPGTKLGPYEVVSPLGAGGMGEVYRARDTKLDRDVAIKVLPQGVARDPDALARFEREAKAVAALSHPGILSIFDFGSHDDVRYAVTELLEGETLRDRLGKAAVAHGKALEWGAQVARALAAAHAKGIVHRDLKPENLFITRDGRAKVLDFGLARYSAPAASDISRTPTQALETEPGTVLGTVGYMSPEQVKGERADGRSDVFSLGCILYELFSGKRAFRKETGAETMTAVLRDEPEDLGTAVPGLQPSVVRVVRRCLEKVPEERFQSASDLAFQLGTLAQASSGSSGVGAAPAGVIPLSRPKRGWPRVAGGLASLTLGLVVFWAGRATVPRATGDTARYTRLTFQRGAVLSARFVPGGRSVVYSAAWEGRKPETFEVRLDSKESRPLGFEGYEVAAVSSKGELALLAEPGGAWGNQTLVRASLGGTEATRPVAEDVSKADFSPDGSELAVARIVGGNTRIEYPLGTPLYEHKGDILVRGLRISPKGDVVAFWDRPSVGAIRLVDRTKKTWPIPGKWRDSWGLAWSPSGKELFAVTGSPSEEPSLRAIDLDGRERLLHRGPVVPAFFDAGPDGTFLLGLHESRGVVAFQGPRSEERDLSWLNSSTLRDLSSDGQTVVFTEKLGYGPSEVFLRRTDGSPAMRLGQGEWPRLSPDGKWVVAFLSSRRQILLFPTGPGEERQLACPETGCVTGLFLADGSGLIVGGQLGTGTFIVPLDGSPWRKLAQGGACHAVSPDGKHFAGWGPAGAELFSLPDGKAEPLRGGRPGDWPVRFSADGKALYVARMIGIPTPVFRIDLSTGERTLWKTLGPRDPTGVSGSAVVAIAPEAGAWAYGYRRTLSSTLFLAEGLR